MAKFIDNNGFAHFLGKLKTLLDRKANTGDVPTKVSDLDNDSGFITGYTETDPTVPAWAKASSKPSYTASEVGAVPTTRKVNGKALSADIALGAADVGALPDDTAIPSKVSELTNDSGFLSEVPDLPASKITSGTFDAARIPSLAASKIGSGTLATARLPDASASAKGAMSAAHYSKLEALPSNATLQATYALKSEITSMYKHKGSVASVANLPSAGQTAGDVYNVTSTGMNYVWTGDAWDALGEVFSIDAMTTTEIDSAFVTAGLTTA